jgi:GTPase
MDESQSRCGYVAIVGRPNVGKSTLLNGILGQKISITAHRPQTTRHRILGIKTVGHRQALYVDTPGLHLARKGALNRYLNRTATSVLADVDVVVFVIEALRWTDEDAYVLGLLGEVKAPVILVVNKVDRLADKRELLPHLQALAQKREFAAVVPLSASTGANVEALERTVIDLLPERDPFFPEDQITDRSERFLAAELIREKLTRRLGQELPYALTVEIEQFKEEGGLARINAVIWVAREGQKKIVIGKGGALLKEIGRQSREDMEALFGRKVFLQLWVKVREGWADDERALRSLGYNE